MQTIISILLFALLATSGLSDKNVCKKLHVGSRTDLDGFNDIVKDGKPTERWTTDSSRPYLTSTIKNLDFFYLVDVGVNLNETDVNLFFDNPEHINSTLTLKKDAQGYYTIGVNYECDSYGASIITFNLEISIPNCGGAEISWRKLCGNPYQERAGFTVEMQFGNFNEKIVRNGKLINAKYFDKDVNSYAVSIPAYINSINFTLYMDTDDIQNIGNNITTNKFNNIPNSPDKRFQTEVFVPYMKADSDQNLLKVDLKGDIPRKGGMVSSETKQNVVMDLRCTGLHGTSTIEIDVLIPRYKNINMFLVKYCQGHIVPEKNSSQVFLVWFFIAVTACFVYATFDNIKTKGKKGLGAVPFYDKFIALYTTLRNMKTKEDVSSDRNDRELINVTSHNDDNDEVDSGFNQNHGDGSSQKHSAYGTL